MPELPEVETIKKTLRHLVVNKTIAHVDVHLPRIVREPEKDEFVSILVGKTILDIDRRGKFLLFRLSEGWTMISHLRMEGNYGLFSANEPLVKHTHVVFSFDDGTQLRYKDTRQFGTMDLLPTVEVDCHHSLLKLGREPFDPEFTAEYFFKRIENKKKPIKALLLDQQVVTGVGNIYADEILFRSGIKPCVLACALTTEQARAVYENIRVVLDEAIEAGGSSVKSYVNGQGEMGMFQQQLYVYQRHGQPCKICGDEIQKMRLGGRGTHYCPSCQK